MVDSDGRNVENGEVRDALQRFLHWLKVNGGQLRGCALRACEEDRALGLSVYTTEDPPSNGILMVTPLFLAITPMTVLQDPSLGSLFAKLFGGGDVDDRLVVMLFILVERLRGDSSFWAPYLKMLPTEFGMSLSFTDDELNELKGTALYKATKMQQTSLKRHFEEKVKGLAEALLESVGWAEREVEFEDFVWANCVFWTRALNVPCPQSLVKQPAWLHRGGGGLMGGSSAEEGFRLEDEIPEILEGRHPSPCGHHQQNEGAPGHGDNTVEVGPAIGSEVGSFSQAALNMETSGGLEPEEVVWVEALVPGIDFCNHARQARVTWEVDDRKGATTGVGYSIYLLAGSNSGLSSNMDVSISYGNKGNEELLFLYGFVVDNNGDDYIMINFPKEALERGVASDAKMLLLEEQKLSLRWLLPLSLLQGNDQKLQKHEVADPSSESAIHTQSFQGYSWSGHRKPPADLERRVFPEELMGALRIIAMSEDDVQGTTELLKELSDPERDRIPTAEDIQAAVWEVCGDAGALQLLHDLLAAKLLELEEGTGPEENDAQLLQKDFAAKMNVQKKHLNSRTNVDDEDVTRNQLLGKNKRACVVYRMGQKHLARCFLKEADRALQSWIT